MDKKVLLKYGMYGAAGIAAVVIIPRIFGAIGGGGDDGGDDYGGLFGTDIMYVPTSPSVNAGLDPTSVVTGGTSAADSAALASINAAVETALAQLSAQSAMAFSSDAASLFALLPQQLFSAKAIGASGAYTVNGIPISFSYSITPAPIPPAPPTQTNTGNPNTVRPRVTAPFNAIGNIKKMYSDPGHALGRTGPYGGPPAAGFGIGDALGLVGDVVRGVLTGDLGALQSAGTTITQNMRPGVVNPSPFGAGLSSNQGGGGNSGGRNTNTGGGVGSGRADAAGNAPGGPRGGPAP